MHDRVVDPASPLGERLSRAVAGRLLARPWFDRAGLFALERWFFPASRLWAAAGAASGDLERFHAEIPMLVRHEDRERVRRILARFDETRAAAIAIETEWLRVFFGADETPATYRVAVEAARRRLDHAHYATRREFRGLLGRAVPRVKLAVTPPEAVEAIYGAAADGRRTPLGLPPLQPVITLSQPLPTAAGRDRWLRFPSPAARLGDTVWARVHEPAGIADPPTVIYGHGICVEFDHWSGLIDECRTLVALGWRIIRPEAPWHGRRAPAGAFGGERIVGSFPTGILDALTGAVQEWAVLCRWARKSSRGPIVLAGSSLGALTSQLAADHARTWPADIRPEALLLITHTGDLGEAVIGGALAGLWASPAELARHGWSEAAARRYLAILDPGPELAVPPEHIVSVLGRRDVILPFAGGRALVERWGVPAANALVLDRGHFSVPMTLIRDGRPLRRLAEIVGDAQRSRTGSARGSRVAFQPSPSSI